MINKMLVIMGRVIEETQRVIGSSAEVGESFMRIRPLSQFLSLPTERWAWISGSARRVSQNSSGKDLEPSWCS